LIRLGQPLYNNLEVNKKGKVKMTDQILNKAVGKKVKEIAHKTGLSKGYHYQELRGDTPNIIQRVKIYLDAEDGDTLIQYLCDTQQGLFYRDLPRISDTDFSIIPKILKEFSDYLNCLSSSLADGVISDAERIKLRKEWSEVAGIVQSLFVAIDRGDYD